MNLAHSLGSGGPEIEALLLATLLLGLGLVSLRQKTLKQPAAIGLVVIGAVLAVGSFTFFRSTPTAQAAEDVSVAFAAPEDGSTVAAGEPVEVEIRLDGAELTEETTGKDPRTGHIHIFVDGDLESMPYTLTPNVTLEPGEHELEVEFVAADHSQFEPRITDAITVEAT